MRVLDLTQPLNSQTPVYADPDGFRDPAYIAEPWATIERQGYSVHRLEMGTHTGTHLDAPAHFHTGARTVDQIPPAAMVGPATIIDVRSWSRVTGAALQPYGDTWLDEALLLFIAPNAGIPLTAEAVATVVDWHPKLILYAGQFVDQGERYYHNRVWLGADIPLVTDLNAAAACVQNGDLLIVAPLPLEGMDGAPCRVLAVRGKLALAK